MIAPEIPANESERLRALAALDILDTPTEERYDRIVSLAARVLEMPIAYVSFVDENRQWLKSQIGMPTDETSRDISFCGHTILRDKPLVIPDTWLDARFADNPLVTGEPHLRFYAGVPLRAGKGFGVGTLCVADQSPRGFDDTQLAILRDFAGLVERELKLVDIIEAQRRLLAVQTQLAESRAHLADELTKAAAYVSSLLPQEKRGSLAVDFRHIPSADLGGDILDFFALDERRMAVYLLDVSGHGIGSALLSVSVMNVLRARALPDTDLVHPEQVLAALNRTFRMSEHDNRYFTMWYGVYEPESHELTYAVGGHPPSLVLCRRADGCRTAEQLPGKGLIVGALPQALYEPVTQKIEPPCELWVFSDGAYEIFPPDDDSGETMLGLQGLIEILEQIPEGDEALDIALERLRDYGGGSAFDDDVSLLRLRFG